MQLASPNLLIFDGAIPNGRAIEFSGIDPADGAGENTPRIDAALSAGGMSTLMSPGVYAVDSLPQIPNTFRPGTGVFLRYNGTNYPWFRWADEPKKKLLPPLNAIRYADNLTEWTLTNSGTAATAVVDPNSPFGVPCVRIDVPNGNTNCNLTFAGATVPGYNGSNGRLFWVVAIEDATIVSQMQSIIGTSGFASSDVALHLVAASNDDNFHGPRIVSHAKTLAYTITDLRLRVFGASVPAGRTARVWVLGAFVKPLRKPFVTLTVDDADITMYTKWLPQLRKRGLHATFGVNKADVGANDGLFINTAKLLEIYAAGIDIASHNLTNTAFGTQTVDQYTADFVTCRDWLKSMGISRGLDYHPLVQGKHSPDLVNSLFGQGVRFMRTVADRNVETEQALWGPAVVPTRYLSNATTLAQAQQTITDAKALGQDVIFMGHVLAATAANSVTWAESDFATLLDGLQADLHAGTIEGVGSVSEWAAARGMA